MAGLKKNMLIVLMCLFEHTVFDVVAVFFVRASEVCSMSFTGLNLLLNSFSRVNTPYTVPCFVSGNIFEQTFGQIVDKKFDQAFVDQRSTHNILEQPLWQPS